MENTPTPKDVSPTLQLADGESIHCGAENVVLRHVVERLLVDVDQKRLEFDATWLPLVLYGESLCGKSSVAHGLANVWKQRFPEEKTIFLTSVDLARMLSKTVMPDDIDRFARQLRSAVLLVVDDVHLLSGRTNADVWLSTLLDYRIRHAKPTIITSNSNIASCPVSDRLRSRLAGGLSVCISLPYAATRKQVILDSAKSFDLKLVDSKVDELVELTNGKPVSGIQTVIASVACNHTNVADETSTDSLEDLVHRLVRSTARRFGIRVADMKGSSRRKNTVLARAIAMFLLREITPLSLMEVGHVFGNRDHSTVRHACEKIKKQIVCDDSIREAVSSICHSLDIRLPSSWFKMLDDKCA